MTVTFTRRRRWARHASVVTGLLTVTALAAGCGSQEPAGDQDPGDGSAVADSEAPVIDPACPQGLTGHDLGNSVDYADADVDGDGEVDAISLGSVAGGGDACAAALVVTTAAGTAAIALPGLQIVPPRAFVPGGAASIGGESVIAAPLSFSPRGGGEVGLFTWVDGALTPVRDRSGQAWTVLATVDDGGGIAQSIDCSASGLSHTQVTSDGLTDTYLVHSVRYALDGAELSMTGESESAMAPREPSRGGDDPTRKGGLSIFTNC